MRRELSSSRDRDRFVMGIDYGTESGRAVVVRARNGELLSSVIVPYTDGVIDARLPGGPKLEHDWALQNPRDYLLVVEKGVPRALKAAGVKPEKVIGLGTDFTASSPLPVKRSALFDRPISSYWVSPAPGTLSNASFSDRSIVM